MLPATTDNQEAPKLTGLQFQFIQLYLAHTHGDAVAACRMMGISEDERVLRRIAGRFLHHPSVQWHIQRHAAQHMAPTEVLALFTAHARGDQGDFWDVDEATGQPRLNLKRAKELGLTRLIKKLAIGKDGQVTLELYDAQAAARDMAKILNMYRPDSNVNIVIQHVLRGLSADVREEVLASLGGLVAGALPSGEEEQSPDVVDAEFFTESGEFSEPVIEVLEEMLAEESDAAD